MGSIIMLIRASTMENMFHVPRVNYLAAYKYFVHKICLEFFRFVACRGLGTAHGACFDFRT